MIGQRIILTIAKYTLIIVTLLVYILLAPNLSAEENVGAQLSFSGFSIMPIKTDNLVLTSKDRIEIDYEKVQERAPIQLHKVIASLETFSRPLESFATLKELVLKREKVRESKYSKSGNRYKAHQYDVTTIQIDGKDCVRAYYSVEDHASPFDSTSVYIEKSLTIRCPHPDSKWRHIFLRYAKIYKKDTTPIVAEREIKQFFNSLKFEPLDESIFHVPGENRTYYFNTYSGHICYSFSLSGKWGPAYEYGALSQEGRRDYVGVLLRSEKELKKFEGKDLLSRAVSSQIKLFEKLRKKSPDSSKVDAFKSSIPGSIKWTARWEFTQGGQTYVAQVVRYMVEVKPGWIAVITGPGPNFDDAARDLLKSLSVKYEPNCYQPEIRNLKQMK
jgi:hypothetical protein